MKTLKLGAIENRLVAGPGYLERHGAPQAPRDLADHRCIIDTNRQRAQNWVFRADGHSVEIGVSGGFQVNSARVARDLAIADRGISYCPKFVLGDALDTGRLVRLLPGQEGPPHDLVAAYLEGRTLPRRVRALIDFAQADIRTAGLL